MQYRVFISSVQREFVRERKAIADYIRRDALFGKFFEVFIFEETPAASVSAQKVYLNEAKNCDVYLGLIGSRYGNEDSKGVSPTEREYDAASSASRHVLVFVRGGSASRREPKEEAFLRRVESERVRRSFKTIRDLRETLAVSLVRFLEEQGKIQTVPFDMCVAGDAGLSDLSVKKMRDFVKTHSSLPPNELLALPMYLKGAIEKTGTGTEDMVKQCRSWGLADPEFTDGPDFRIVIRRQVSGANRTVPTVGDDPANVPANGTMDGTINGTLALRIVSVLTKSPSTTLDQLAKRLNVARRSLVRYMNIMQNNNRIRRVGGKRFGHWEVLDSQSE